MAQTQTQEDLDLMRQMSGQAGQRNNLMAVFSMEPVELAEETKRERREAEQKARKEAADRGEKLGPEKWPESVFGRPVYEEQEFVTIYIPGDKDNVIFRPVRNVDKVQYGDQYRAFKANKEQPVSGTPLDKLPFMSKAQCLELSYFGIKTAEQLVGASDAAGQRIIGWSQLKRQVQSFLDAAAGAAPTQKLHAELEKRDNEIATLRAALEEQRKRIDAMASNRKG